MKVLFYSQQCKFCNDIIKQLKESNFYKEFNLISVDNNTVPDKIKIVPTIIDSDYKDLLEGKKAFEYLYNNKYFNISTNNFLLWKDKEMAKPEIEENAMAFKQDILQQSYQDVEKPNNKPIEKSKKKKPKISNSSLIKLKLRR